MLEKRRFVTKGGMIFATVLAMTTMFLSYFKIFAPLELLTYDRMLRLQAAEHSDNVVIVAMDEKSLREYGPLPWSRELHARAVEQLSKADVAAIGYDVLFDKARDVGDAALTAAVKNSGKVVFPVVIDELKQDGGLIELQPYPELYQVSSGLGVIHFESSDDTIARGVYLKSGLGEPYWRAFAAEVLEVANGEAPYGLPFESHLHDEYSRDSSKIQRTHFALIPYKTNPDYFSRISFVDVVNGDFDVEQFKGRVAFVGVTARAARNADFLPVPVGRDGRAMAGVEISATLYQGLKDGTMILPMNSLVVSLVSGALVLLLFMLIPRSMPRYNVFLVLLMAFSMLFCSWVLLHGANYWLPLVTPSIMMVIGYLLWAWRAVVANMAFFRNTVKRLQLEVSNSFEPEVKSSYEKHFQFWKRLKLIRGWSEDERDILDYDHSLPVEVHDQRWLVDLGNQTDGERALFDKLYRQTTAIREEQLSQGSVIEEKVAQVQVAITKINFLRRFVERTMDKMSDGVLLIDISGVVFYANLEVKKYVDVVVGVNIFEVLSQLTIQSQADWAEELKSVLVDGVGREVQAINANKRYFKVGISLLDHIEGQDFIIINLTDITSVKREQQRQLEMIDFISHDLRSPMTSVLALISQYRNQSNGMTSEDLNKEIERLTQSSLSLSEHFLMLSRAESDIELPLYPVELLNSIDSALAIARPLAAEKNIQVIFEFSDYRDTWLQANEDLLERVILNLLTNAIKYSPQRSEVEVTVSESNEGISVLVRDQGEGIAPEQMDTIFKPFSRIRRHEIAKIQGIGLGLRFVRAAMDRFGGDVSVNSEVGKGSSFILFFPNRTIVNE